MTEQRLIFALWGILGSLDVLRGLADPVQLNLDDDAVATAQLRFAQAEPIKGFVTVPAQVGADAVVAALEGLVTRTAGWLVETETVIVPPVVPKGSRADALANIAVLRKPADQGYDEWLHAWKVLHTPVAIATQNTSGYLQNRVVEAVTPGAPEVVAFVEELFPMAALTDFHEFYGSAGDDAELASRMEQMMASVGRFGADRDLDLVPTSRYLL